MEYLKTLGSYYLNQRVDQQFQKSHLEELGLTPSIAGTVVKLFETRYAGYAVIRQSNGDEKLVCLGGV